MRWTKRVNMDLMRAYLQVKDGERNMPGYRLNLEIKWAEIDLEIKLPDQKLSHQVRLIMKCTN